MSEILTAAEKSSAPLVPIDVAELRDRLRDHPKLLAELAEIFRDDAPRQIEKIRVAVTRSDARGLEMASHALKGAASVLFALPVAEAARRLEIMGRSGKLAGAPQDFEILQNEWARLKLALDELCIEVKVS
jgi:two-component system, sensor histidine kinase and response regulator